MLYSVCIDSVFENLDSIKAIEHLKSIGHQNFEFWGWWNKDMPEIVKAVSENQMNLTALCTRFISLVDPAMRDAYLQGLKETVEAAKLAGCKEIISQVGNDRGISRNEQMGCLRDGLREAADIVEAADMTLLVEPLNTRINHPGYFLQYSDEAFDLIDCVGSRHVKILFDVYHQQITEGNVLNNILPNLDKIGHFHSAGSAGRHELWEGELNYRYICEKIAEAGFTGYFGLEYFPVTDPLESVTKTLQMLP